MNQRFIRAPAIPALRHRTEQKIMKRLTTCMAAALLAGAAFAAGASGSDTCRGYMAWYGRRDAARLSEQQLADRTDGLLDPFCEGSRVGIRFGGPSSSDRESDSSELCRATNNLKRVLTFLSGSIGLGC